MLTPIEVVLVGLIVVQLILNHLRKTDCDERVQRVEDETRRNTVNAYMQFNRHCFELYRYALEEAGLVKRKENKDEN